MAWPRGQITRIYRICSAAPVRAQQVENFTALMATHGHFISDPAPPARVPIVVPTRSRAWSFPTRSNGGVRAWDPHCVIWPVATATATSSMYLLPGPSAVADWLTPFEDLAMRSTSVATRYLACFAAGNRKVSEWRRRLVFLFVLQLPRDNCPSNCL